MSAGKFERDIMRLVDRLCKGEEEYISNEIRRLGESLILFISKYTGKINHPDTPIINAPP